MLDGLEFFLCVKGVGCDSVTGTCVCEWHISIMGKAKCHTYIALYGHLNILAIRGCGVSPCQPAHIHHRHAYTVHSVPYSSRRSHSSYYQCRDTGMVKPLSHCWFVLDIFQQISGLGYLKQYSWRECVNCCIGSNLYG